MVKGIRARKSKQGVSFRKSAAAKARIAVLGVWFKTNARRLPWREARTGYTALVSEAMLQQTQVARVIESYQQFMRRFPTVHDLAAADEQEVLAQWRGLGYYRRARNLHAAARTIVREFNGVVPSTLRALRQLPGVGPYTAGAIASIVFNEPVPIVDGNVMRVLARWHAKRQRANESSLAEWAWATAEKHVHLTAAAKRAGVFNEALMELGATVCTPRSPRCGNCPVSRWCESRRRGLQEVIPVPRARATPRRAHHHAVLVLRRGKLLVQQRPSDAGMWSSMWQTPTIEADRPLDLVELKKCLPFTVANVSKIAEFDHHTTHRKIRFHVYRAHSGVRKGQWRGLGDFDDLPMSNAQRKVLSFASVNC